MKKSIILVTLTNVLISPTLTPNPLTTNTNKCPNLHRTIFQKIEKLTYPYWIAGIKELQDDPYIPKKAKEILIEFSRLYRVGEISRKTFYPPYILKKPSLWAIITELPPEETFLVPTPNTSNPNTPDPNTPNPNNTAEKQNIQEFIDYCENIFVTKLGGQVSKSWKIRRIKNKFYRDVFLKLLFEYQSKNPKEWKALPSQFLSNTIENSDNSVLPSIDLVTLYFGGLHQLNTEYVKYVKRKLRKRRRKPNNKDTAFELLLATFSESELAKATQGKTYKPITRINQKILANFGSLDSFNKERAKIWQIFGGKLIYYSKSQVPFVHSTPRQEVILQEAYEIIKSNGVQAEDTPLAALVNPESNSVNLDSTYSSSVSTIRNIETAFQGDLSKFCRALMHKYPELDIKPKNASKFNWYRELAIQIAVQHLNITTRNKETINPNFQSTNPDEGNYIDPQSELLSWFSYDLNKLNNTIYNWLNETSKDKTKH